MMLDVRKIIGYSILLVIFPVLIHAQVLFEDNFEDSNSFSLWTQNTDTNISIWERGSAFNLSSFSWNIPQHSTFITTNDDDCNCDKSKDQILSPKIFVRGQDSLLLQFDVYFNGAFYNGVTEQAYIFYKTNDQIIYRDTLQGNTTWISHIYPLIVNDTIDSLQIGFEYSDQGSWMFGLALDNVMLTVMNSVDLSLQATTLNSIYALNDSILPSIQIYNSGFDTVQNVVLYALSDTSTYLKSLTYLPPYSSTIVQLNQWIPLSNINQSNITFWTKDSLGIDNQAHNDTLTHSFIILPTKNYKNALVESFTSASCSQCRASQDNFYDVLEANQVNYDGHLFHIEYHVESNGIIDSAYLDHNTQTLAHYNSTALPYYLVQGSSIPKSTELFNIGEVSLTQLEYSNLKITNNYQILNDSIFVQVDVEGLSREFSADDRLISVLVERNMNLDSVYWKNVARAYLTNPEGVSITDTLNPDSIYSFHFSNELIQANPILSNSGCFSNLNDNLAVISFIRNNVTGNILQVTGSNWPLKVSDYRAPSSNLSIYPNPSSSSLIDVFFETPEHNYVLELYTMTGQLIWKTSKTNNKSKIQIPYNLHGMYILKASDSKQSQQVKFILN